jgi:hypothetical protein
MRLGRVDLGSTFLLQTITTFVSDFSRNLDCLGKEPADSMRVPDCGLLFIISPKGRHAYGTQI